jgi:hypothetical protein
MRPGQPSIVLVSFLVLLGTGPSRAGIKENLDLPFDAIGDDIDDLPIESIVFYGMSLEGDGFFYAIDKSSSMAQGELDRARAEVRRNIAEFSSVVEFGIVFFDRQVLKFPANGRPAQATEAMKQAAAAFIDSVHWGHGSCCRQGLLAALEIAHHARAHRKVLVYLGDGGGTCESGTSEAQYLDTTLATVTSRNYERVKIHTIGVLDVSDLGETFLRRLAAANGGSYRRIP